MVKTPPEWSPPKDMACEIDPNTILERVIKQEKRNLAKGRNAKCFVVGQEEKMTLGAFKAEALERQKQIPEGIEESAKYYWDEKVTQVKYGADNPLSLRLQCKNKIVKSYLV